METPKSYRRGRMLIAPVLSAGLTALASACAPRTGEGWVMSVHSVQGAAPKGAPGEAEPTEPTEETIGTLLVGRGEIEGEPSQLWLYVPETVTSGGEYSAPPASGQLFWGESSYASKRLEARLRFSEDFFLARVEVEASEPEIDTRNRGDERFSLEAEVVGGDALSWGSLPAGTSWLPRRDPSIPDRLPFVAGQEPPDGYALESYRRWDLAGLGLATFAVSYGLPVAIAAEFDFENGSEVITIPVVGPLVIYGRFLQNSSCCALGIVSVVGHMMVGSALVGASVLQAGGLTLFGVGLLRKDHRWVRAPKPFTFQPWVGPEAQGASVTGSF